MQIHQSQMSPKQGSLLFKATGRKFWEPENIPAPTVKEASELISLIMEYLQEKKEESGEKATLIAQRWFPEFSKAEIRWRFWGKKNGEDKPQQQPEPQTAKQPKSKKEPKAPKTEPAKQEVSEEFKKAEKEFFKEPKAEPKKEEPAKDKPVKSEPTAAVTVQNTSDSLTNLKALIQAGIRNIWLHGPAGCGKTTVCKLAGDELFLPVTILSCSAGTSPGEFIGFRFPTPSPSAITEAITMPGIVVLDEMPMLQPDVAAVSNALLANNEINTVVGLRVRHPDCVIVATANTTGNGADRQYVGNNQLDAATLDRFAGGFIEVDYSTEYEGANYDEEVCAYCWRLRLLAKQHNLRRIISTRSIQSGTKLKAAGMNWKAMLVSTWTADERRVVA